LVQFLPLKIELATQLRIHGYAPLSVHFRLGAEVLRVKQQVLHSGRIFPVTPQKLFVLAPGRNAVYLTNTGIETGYEQLTFRKAVEILLENCG